MTPDYAWAHREGRNTRYDNKRVGGTICVHFIKKNMWFLETALAFLETQDATELEMRPSEPDGEIELMSSGSGNVDSRKTRPRPGSSPEHREDLADVEPDLVEPDPKKGHDVPMRHVKDMHVLLIQPDAGAEGLHIDMEGGRGGSGGSVVLPADEFEWPEGVPGGDGKRGVYLNTHEEDDGETTTLPTAGHFANGSRRVNNR